MPALFDLPGREAEPSVRAVPGHRPFGCVHPRSDGNRRMARFLMNVMSASGGHPWNVIRVEDCDACRAAPEAASVDGDIGPFSAFIAERMRRSMKEAA